MNNSFSLDKFMRSMLRYSICSYECYEQDKWKLWIHIHYMSNLVTQSHSFARMLNGQILHGSKVLQTQMNSVMFLLANKVLPSRHAGLIHLDFRKARFLDSTCLWVPVEATVVWISQAVIQSKSRFFIVSWSYLNVWVQYYKHLDYWKSFF